MTLRTALAVGAVLLAGAAVARAFEWAELGPAPIANGEYTGRVSAVACSPTDPLVYYVGGADGGVWKTSDGGVTWTALTDEMPTTSIGALAIDPTNPDVVYAGTGEANYANHCRHGLGIYKTTDGGASWTVLAGDTFAGRTFSRLIVHPTNSQVLFAAVARAGGFPALAAAKGHPGANGPVGIFQSTDGGQSWTQLLNGLPAEPGCDILFHPTNANILYAAIGNIFGGSTNGVYKSTDGGASWTKLTTGLPPLPIYGRITLAIAPSNPSRIYALLCRPSDSSGGSANTLGCYRSDNDGANWAIHGDITGLQSSYGWYLSTLTVDPTNPDTVFAGGVGLLRSTNAGDEWWTVTPPHVDIHATEWDADHRLVCGNDGGVHRSGDRGDSWSSLNSGLGLIQFYAGVSTHPTQLDYILGGTQDNGTSIRGVDTAWNQVIGGDGGWTQIDQNNPLRLFGEYQGSGNLFRSTNGGSSFNSVGSGINTSDRNCFLPPYLIDPANSNRMFYATHRVYRSINGGLSWNAISPDLTASSNAAIRTLAIAPSNSSIMYAATNNGRVLRSSDGGVSFTLIASGVPGWPRTTRELFVHPTDPNDIYLAVGYYNEQQVRHSADGGQTWECLDDDGLPNVPINTVAADVRRLPPLVFAGADDGLYVRDGITWHRYGTGLPNTPVIDLRIEPARNRLLAATQGRGLWSIPLPARGDMNCDGAIDFDDVKPFALAITGPAAFLARHPGCIWLNADCDANGAVDFDDIKVFVRLLQ